MVLMLLSTVGQCGQALPSPLSPMSMSKHSSSFFAMIAPVFSHDGMEDETPATPCFDQTPSTPTKPHFSFQWTPTVPGLRPPPLNPASRTLQKALPPIPQEEQDQAQFQQQSPSLRQQHNYLPVPASAPPPPPPPSSYASSQRRGVSHIRSGSAPLQNTQYMNARGLRKVSTPVAQPVRQPSPGPAPSGPLPEIPQAEASSSQDFDVNTHLQALAYTNVSSVRDRSNTITSRRGYSRSASPFARKPVPSHSKSASVSSTSSSERGGFPSPRTIYSSPRPVLSPRVDSLPSNRTASPRRSIPSHSHSGSDSSVASFQTVLEVREEEEEEEEAEEAKEAEEEEEEEEEEKSQDSPLSISIAMSGIDLAIDHSPTSDSTSTSTSTSRTTPNTPSEQPRPPRRSFSTPSPSSCSTYSCSSATSYFSSVQIPSPSLSLTCSTPTSSISSAASSPDYYTTSISHAREHNLEKEIGEAECMDVPLLIEPRCLLQSPRAGGSKIASAGFSRTLRPRSSLPTSLLSSSHRFPGGTAGGQGIVGVGTLASVQEVF